MKITNITAASPYSDEKFVAEEFLEGSQSNVRIIRLNPGQVLPPHKHGNSDLMLYVVEGIVHLDTDNGEDFLGHGSLVYISHDEELRASNQREHPVTLLAFLTPKFPPRD